jgi:hypothetical protein
MSLVFIEGMAAFGKTTVLNRIQINSPFIDVKLFDYFEHVKALPEWEVKHLNQCLNLSYSMNNVTTIDYFRYENRRTGRPCVIDRHPIATIAYHWIYSDKEDFNNVFPPEPSYLSESWKQDKVIVCICTDFEGINEGIKKRDSGARFDSDVPIEFHVREARIFREIAKRYGWTVFEIVKYNFTEHHRLEHMIYELLLTNIRRDRHELVDNSIAFETKSVKPLYRDMLLKNLKQ